MINSLNKYDIVVVKFPFASSLKYKARPAVIISSSVYNKSERGSCFILAISSQVDTKLNFEPLIVKWKEAGLLKHSIFKSSIATIENNFIIQKLGVLEDIDKKNLDNFMKKICQV